jgi:hypothetical protein
MVGCGGPWLVSVSLLRWWLDMLKLGLELGLRLSRVGYAL